jgi:2-C-methyl-D-erythritol 4-phosphate cytidylyltransferase
LREKLSLKGAEGSAHDTSLVGKRIAALIPAAGSGRRMGGPLPKPFLRLGAREILARTLEVFEACAAVDEVWVITAPEYCAFCRQEIVEQYGLRKVKGVVAGGATRQESVWQGLQQVGNSVDLVVVHDGVRPFITATLLQETLHCAALYGAAITAVPIKDTLKRVSAAGEVEATVPRERLWRVQTPQAFQRHLLQAAFCHAWDRGIEATDEAGLVEALGQRIKVVPGDENNIKITTPDDLRFSETVLRTLD